MNKYESILYLRSPKLLSDVVSYVSDNKSKLDFNDFRLPHFNKNEKANKVNYKGLDFTEDKKSKNKYKKKVRNKVHIDKNISQIKDELDFNEMNTDSLIRNSKNLKMKKNHKYKTISNTNKLIVDDMSSKDIYLDDLLTVEELSVKLRVSSLDIIKWLFLQGISITINQSLDLSISTLVAKHYSFNVLKEKIEVLDSKENKKKKQIGRSRAPVITLLGHVDHGKTTLLRTIRKDQTLIKEAGNITQSVGAYEVFIDNSGSVNKLIFLDTPGHEAFIDMRKIAADITDIVILVVAADDGLKPQTIEAIHHIQSRNLPFIVAINKVDKSDADISRVKKQLSEFNIFTVDSQGNKVIIEISSLNGYNFDVLLSSLITLSEINELKSDPSCKAEGEILEAYLNRQKGTVAQILVRNGSLYLGDIVVAGNFYGKVKAIHNSLNQSVKSIESTSLAYVLCFTEVPTVGLSFVVVDDEKKAKFLVSSYIDVDKKTSVLNNRVSLDDQQPEGSKPIIKQINLIIKTSNRGSVDAIVHTLAKVPQEKVQINLLMVACGDVSLKDIELAITSNSVILTFGLNISLSLLRYAEEKGIFIAKFCVIYDLIDYVKQHMLKLIDVDYEKKILGYAQVKNLFFVSKRVVAGCFVQSGILKRNAYFEVRRGSHDIYVGSIDSLKRIKEDVDEVNSGNECGVLCNKYNLWKVEDSIECYELKALGKTL